MRGYLTSFGVCSMFWRKAGLELFLTPPPHSPNYVHTQIITLIMSIIVVQPVLLNAQSNWLLGSLLITAYCFCGFAFFFEQGQ